MLWSGIRNILMSSLPGLQGMWQKSEWICNGQGVRVDALLLLDPMGINPHIPDSQSELQR